MKDSTIKQMAKNGLSQEIATRTTDPNFYGALNYLPNPDVILQKMGRTQEVFEAIMSDAHVIGEMRSFRAGILGFEYRLQAGGDDKSDLLALELCQKVLDSRPDNWIRWPDIIWNMAQAPFRGYRVHEVVWGMVDGYQLPIKVVDRPERRFVFDDENKLRILSKKEPQNGEHLDPYRWLVTRHMPSFDNPYGIALLSSCFWPYTFKHSGFKYFVKFCEKYGIPKAIGKVPAGTSTPQKGEFADNLEAMIEDAVAVIDNDGSVELLETSAGGELVHERLINICNKEMSKALTSQTLATEIQGEGSRAASETHREREQSVNESDRGIICDTFNDLFEWVTELNVPNAKPPKFEFYQEEQARKEWVDVFASARDFIDIPTKFAHDRLQIPQASNGDDVLPKTATPTMQASNFSAFDFKKNTSVEEQAINAADDWTESLIDDVKALLFKSKSLDDFENGLIKLYPDIDDAKLGEMSAMAMMFGQLKGYK